MNNTRLFRSAREAKEFLVSKIVEQAQHEEVPLSDIERKMLYFSETDCSLPNTGAVSEEFDGGAMILLRNRWQTWAALSIDRSETSYRFTM